MFVKWFGKRWNIMFGMSWAFGMGGIIEMPVLVSIAPFLLLCIINALVWFIPRIRYGVIVYNPKEAEAFYADRKYEKSRQRAGE